MTANTPSTRQKKNRITGQNHQGFDEAAPATASVAEASAGQLMMKIISKNNR
jgi:hypothetical protein